MSVALQLEMHLNCCNESTHSPRTYGARVLEFGEQEKKELYDLRLMLESFAFSKLKYIDRKSD